MQGSPRTTQDETPAGGVDGLHPGASGRGRPSASRNEASHAWRLPVGASAVGAPRRAERSRHDVRECAKQADAPYPCRLVRNSQCTGVTEMPGISAGPSRINAGTPERWRRGAAVPIPTRAGSSPALRLQMSPPDPSGLAGPAKARPAVFILSARIWRNP